MRAAQGGRLALGVAERVTVGDTEGVELSDGDALLEEVGDTDVVVEADADVEGDEEGLGVDDGGAKLILTTLAAGTPPAFEKPPPTYRSEPDTASA